jgi:CRISPR/Cas system-associated exonuclease Cas4 (RecB family)
MITKSDLQSFLQCPRKLWLERQRPDLIPTDDPTLYRRATDGNIVGEEARKQLGQDVIWSSAAESYESAVRQAQKLLSESPGKPAAEVPMYKSGLYARADALIPDGAGYVLRETKSSTFPLKRDKTTPDAPEEHHLNDIAIQIWVMQDGSVPMTRAELNLLNNQWRYPGDGDYMGLFRQMDVTVEAQRRAALVPGWKKEAENILREDMPTVVTGKQCKDPYPCPFITFCQDVDPPGPEHPIELLPDAAGKNLAKKLRDTKGYTSILEPQPSELTGTQAELYRRIQQAHRSESPVLAPGSAEVMSKFAYPRYYFDFESIDLPVPRWVGVRPYEHITFQWSCHIERKPGIFEHVEFLDLTGNDPSIGCLESMRKTISADDDGPIFVYFATYEKGRLQELAQRHPEYSDLLENYVARLVDLWRLVRDYYYHPKMRGSFSMKRVLPVIAPELDYGELEEVQEGTGAQVAYLYAVFDPSTASERKADLEKKLRLYCRQDTWAMVEVAYFLAQAGRPERPGEG